ncbi:MAG: hypothetical protein ACF8R7_10435 [Phycisphaerales bacterium JB039]
MPQTDSSSRRRRRFVGLTIAAIGTLALIGTGAEMARRVSAHHATSDREQFVFNPVVERGFTYAGREVTITDLDDPERVRITYGDEQLDIIPTMESLSPDLPGIARHEPWMRILRFAPRRGLSLGELERRIEAGEIADRLVIVLRQPPAGAQPGTVEQAARSLWTFTFHELLPEGGFRTQRLRYPESERAFLRRQREARAEGRDIERRADELREGSWEYYAALLVMPPLAAPAPTFVGDAVGSMGWTLPATSLLILLVMGSLAFALAPSREDVERRTA